jgi:3-deoxy-manno-octulosonate cytidylyltransferase (CMP-KDO synthetase)
MNKQKNLRVVGLIPVRLNSSRLPRKALLPIKGMPMIAHTLYRAKMAKLLTEVYVCTDSYEIADVVLAHGGKIIMTRSDHANGTERIAEAAKSLNADLIIDIQGDEPLLDPEHIDAVINAHILNPQWDILLPSMPIQDPVSQHIVKVVHDNSFKVLFLSRSIIPNSFRSSAENAYLKHLSIISFRPSALEKFASLPMGKLECIEGIELMRALENGQVIGTKYLDGDSFSIDVQENYDHAISVIDKNIHTNKYLK